MTSASEDASRRANLLGRPLERCPLLRLTALARTTSSADSGLSEAARFLQCRHHACKLVLQLGPKSTKSCQRLKFSLTPVPLISVGAPGGAAAATQGPGNSVHIKSGSCYLCLLAGDFGLGSFPEDDLLLRGTAICNG